ncbi:serine hydrolase [Nocardia uniformis]|uniref:Serine hydrolase n=1 Tax=Nocardia uniformis TaxID=53432 RepID=A0A849BUQ4_9NOCA|nr:serine hydrolase [Nocardia uniformis]
MRAGSEPLCAADLEQSLHALDIADGRKVAIGADERVVIASSFRILLMLECGRQVMAGQIDPTERVLVRAADRLGGWGTAGCADDVEMSLRDLSYFAMSVSDNSAADLLLHRIGRDTPVLLATELGLEQTRVIGAGHPPHRYRPGHGARGSNRRRRPATGRAPKTSRLLVTASTSNSFDVFSEVWRSTGSRFHCSCGWLRTRCAGRC